jgi:AcrR family transcriptional regulator
MPRPRSDIQPRLLRAARDRFLREGVDGASLRNIARDAGTSVGMLYYYFPTKDDLFFAVVEERYGKLLADLAEAFVPTHSPAERLRSMYRRVGRMGDDDLMVVKLVIREALLSSARLQRLVERFMRGHLPLILGTLVDGVRDGSLRADLPPPVLFIATMALGMATQLARRAVGTQAFLAGAPEGETLADAALEVLLHGVAAPEGRLSEGPPTPDGARGGGGRAR